MKIWIDDVRESPKGYIHLRSVDEAINYIEDVERLYAKEGLQNPIEVIDLDHDAGEYARLGGDYINILNWLEETGRKYPIKIHSMNPVGVRNMRRIIDKNRWEER